MIQLSLDKAHEYVLQTLDELKSLGDVTMLTDGDELDTRKLTEGYIIEAVLKAHKDAPSYLIDGIAGVVEPVEEDKKQGEVYDYSVTITDNVAHIAMLQKSARLASLKASDSHVVVTDHASEESPIGRMQNNPYVRGTYDDPRLIVKKVWKKDHMPEYLYHSVKDNTATFQLEYVPYPEVKESKVSISAKLEYAVLNLLVAMVLDSLSLHDKADLYKNKYQEHLQTAR